MLAQDECLDSTVLKESLCQAENSRQTVAFETVQCPGQCRNGACAAKVKGDLNSDGRVNNTDLQEWLAKYYARTRRQP